MVFNKSENNERMFGMVLGPGIDRERECLVWSWALE